MRVLYATQAATDPPTFTLFANREVPPYLRYLERSLREGFDLGATPIKMRSSPRLTARRAACASASGSAQTASAKRSSSSSVVT